MRGGFALGLWRGKGLVHKTRVIVLVFGEVKVGMARDVYVNFGGGRSPFSVFKLR